MKTIGRLIAFGLFAVFNGLSAPCVEAHGTGHRVIRDAGAVAVESFYSDREPMSYAEVKLYGPSDDSIEYQNGRTDKNGRFAFLPDQEGTWRMEVGDGMGHLMRADIDVKKPEKEETPSGETPVAVDAAPPGIPMPWKAALGLSLIANLSLIAYVWQKRRRPSRA